MLHHAIEAASLQAWPAIEEHRKGPLVLRYAGGYTKRANSVAVTDYSAEVHTGLMDFVESWYAEHELPVIYRLPEFVPASLDGQLAARGYEKADTTLVMSHDLTTISEVQGCEMVRFTDGREWLAAEATLYHRHAGDRAMMENILARNAGNNDYLLMEDGGSVTACGLGVRTGKFYAIFCIHTGTQYRRQGYGSALVCAMLRRAKREGAVSAWLQVVNDNTAAKALYTRLGFIRQYAYWYRVRS